MDEEGVIIGAVAGGGSGKGGGPAGGGGGGNIADDGVDGSGELCGKDGVLGVGDRMFADGIGCFADVGVGGNDSLRDTGAAEPSGSGGTEDEIGGRFGLRGREGGGGPSECEGRTNVLEMAISAAGAVGGRTVAKLFLGARVNKDKPLRYMTYNPNSGVYRGQEPPSSRAMRQQGGRFELSDKEII